MERLDTGQQKTPNLKNKEKESSENSSIGPLGPAEVGQLLLQCEEWDKKEEGETVREALNDEARDKCPVSKARESPQKSY